MTQSEHYSKAPITEAVIDFQLEPREGITAQELLAIADVLDPQYIDRSEIRGSEVFFNLNQESSAKTTHIFLGYRFSSVDNQYILQVRTNGFTLSKLAPYDRWEPFRDEARRLWGIYKELAEPVAITRVATRYINQFTFVGTDAYEFANYFRVFPTLSEDFPSSSVSGFFMQLQMPQRDLDCTAVLNQVRLPDPQPGSTAIILDYDIFKDSIWPIDKDEEAWNFLEQLRDRKNVLFNASITDLARELIL